MWHHCWEQLREGGTGLEVGGEVMWESGKWRQEYRLPLISVPVSGLFFSGTTLSYFQVLSALF
jgi:hypothetical protein